MTRTQEIQPGRRIDLAREVVGLDGSDRLARLVRQQADRAPQRIDGFTIGAPRITGDAPHDGEVHPDGDELLYLISGAVTVTLELAGGDVLVDLGAGDAVVVPKGVWQGSRSDGPWSLTGATMAPGFRHEGFEFPDIEALVRQYPAAERRIRDLAPRPEGVRMAQERSRT